MANILLFGHYYNNRVDRTPEDYYEEMTSNRIGCLDLDGICPYAGEDENGELKFPEESALREYFDSKANTVKWSDGEKVFGGRPSDFMEEAVCVSWSRLDLIMNASAS